MNSIVKKHSGFFYLRYVFLLLFGIYALLVQSNNPRTLVYTLGITWLVVAFITGLMFYFKITKKKFSLVYLVFLFIDLIIAGILLYKSEFIATHFAKFIGILAIIMSFSLIVYRSKNGSNMGLYVMMTFIFIFGFFLFFDSFVSDVFTSYLIAIFFTIVGLMGILFTARIHLNENRKIPGKDNS
ncbi:MAG: hypothetical protein ACK4KT_06665 [Thermaurantimonas sp.]